MFTLELRQGRLVEGRISSPVVMTEVLGFAKRFQELVGPVSGQVSIVTDIRGAHVFPPDVADGFVKVMKIDNPRLARSAFLINESATFGLQVERMIRDGGNPARRTFREADALSKWLGEHLDAKERARLGEFLAHSSR